MTAPVKLLDLENSALVDACLEYLSDQNDFLVVGVVGYQGVGKSTILSLLAEPKLLNKKWVLLMWSWKILFFNYSIEKIIKINVVFNILNDSHFSKYIFNIEKTEDLETAVHKTNGIDVYITNNRTLFLDTQPILSPSSYIRLFQQQDSLGKKFQHSDYCVESNDVEIQSLQLITFLYSVCHIVLFVQDYWFDPDFIR